MSKKNLLNGIFTATAVSLFASAAFASDAHVAPMTDFANSTVKQWISDSMVIEAVKAQNARHAGLSQADIDKMDKDWRAQTDASSKPMIDAILGNALLLCQLRRDDEQMAQVGLIHRSDVVDRGDGFVGNNQYMGRCLGVDVPERGDPIVLKNDIGRHFAANNFAENGFFWHNCLRSFS